MNYGINYMLIHGTFWALRWGAFAGALYLALRAVDTLLTGGDMTVALLCCGGALVACLFWFALGKVKDEVLRA